MKSNIQFWERDSVVFQRKKVKFHHYAFEQMHFASVEFWLGLPSYTTEDDMSQIYEKKKSVRWTKNNEMFVVCCRNLTPITLCDVLNRSPARFELFFVFREGRNRKHEVAVGSSKVATKRSQIRLLPVTGADDTSLRISF